MLHHTPIPLDDASPARMALLRKIRNRRRSVGICKHLRLLRFQYASSASSNTLPVGIWCPNDVVSTSMRRDHVASTLIRRHFNTKCLLGCLYDFAMLVTMPPLLPRLMTSKGASTTLPLRQRIWSYASSAPTTMQMRSYYDLRASEVALMLHLCCALKPLLCKPAGSRASAAAAEHQPSNKAYNTCIIMSTWQS